MASNNQSLTPSLLLPSEIELINRVHSYFPNNESNKFRSFDPITSRLSNFYPCTFFENNIQFNSSEQYIMYHKAKLFNDHETAKSVLQTTNPADCKALGRLIKNFDEKLWINNRTQIVSNGLYLKFTQNDRLKKALLKHYGRLLVEAAENDKIWGVGLKKDDPLIKNRSNWKGLNLLGLYINRYITTYSWLNLKDIFAFAII